ncbi:MAG: hypothetical protein VB047_09455 [Anaerotignum propionicum]|uniref:hypothetical protein n=1 Tax=Anaerotignum propionicum TaxID=28446 RepID=UPI002B1EE2D7|nr:hypothetical protein [Anaerotignum propionicum]MEA5057766.1 hypothetical protein [Anaerotignum propionicum]
MYEIQNEQTNPVNFFAGDFPIVTAVGMVATGKTVKKYEPVKLTANGIEPVVAVAASEKDTTNVIPAKTAYENTTEGIYGISASEAAAGEDVVIYVTGEFFADAIEIPVDVAIETLTKAFRNIGIFLK